MARNESLKLSTLLAAFITPVLLCTGCFTGVESTKTVTLSRRDIRSTAPTCEDLYLADICGTPLSEWREGRPFFVADDRLSLLLVQRSLPADSALHPHRGDTLRFSGISTETHPDGVPTMAIHLRGKRGEYILDTSRSEGEAMTGFTSFSTESLIDLNAIDSLRSKMTGQILWTRTSLWYDAEDEDFHGKKYIPVTITAIEPGTMVFPVHVSFRSDEGRDGNYYMSLDNGSRRFPTLFFLEDPRKRYSGIEPAVWTLICNGRVAAGMTKEECRLALGSPLDSDSGRTYTSTVDVWMYEGGRYLKFEDGILVDFRQ